MRLFTISSGKIIEGIKVSKLFIKNAEIIIPAIIIGEEGRGSERGVLPVQLLPESQKEWEEKGSANIILGEIGITKAGKPKLFQKNVVSASEEKCLCVFYTHIGFRGSNSHTGDRTGQNKKNYSGENVPEFSPFPGEIFIKGIISQGAAGRMGSGDQYIAIMPPCIFRTAYHGRLYGAPGSHYYKWNGEKMLGGITWEERVSSDLF